MVLPADANPMPHEQAAAGLAALVAEFGRSSERSTVPDSIFVESVDYAKAVVFQGGGESRNVELRGLPISILQFDVGTPSKVETGTGSSRTCIKITDTGFGTVAQLRNVVKIVTTDPDARQTFDLVVLDSPRLTLPTEGRNVDVSYTAMRSFNSDALEISKGASSRSIGKQIAQQQTETLRLLKLDPRQESERALKRFGGVVNGAEMLAPRLLTVTSGIDKQFVVLTDQADEVLGLRVVMYDNGKLTPGTGAVAAYIKASERLRDVYEEEAQGSSWIITDTGLQPSMETISVIRWAVNEARDTLPAGEVRIVSPRIYIAGHRHDSALLQDFQPKDLRVKQLIGSSGKRELGAAKVRAQELFPLVPIHGVHPTRRDN